MAAAVFMADTFQTMQHLAQSAPAEQAEILAAAREAYSARPKAAHSCVMPCCWRLPVTRRAIPRRRRSCCASW